MKRITSFTHLKTGEGDRIAYTYSEISELGEITSQNNKGGFVATDTETQSAIETIIGKIYNILEAKEAN